MPPSGPISDIDTRVVESSRIVACVPTSSAFARLKQVSLAQLVEYTFLLLPPEVEPGVGEQILNVCRQAGLSPRVEQHRLRAVSMMTLVSAGIGVAFLPESVRSTGFDGVTFLPIIELPNFSRQLVVGWRDAHASEAARTLVEILAPN
jgi:DNA-binding transcriptional LysR family regulator